LTTERRIPAEWEPQSAVMLTWPHANTDWSDCLENAEAVFMDIARSVLRFQNLLVSCEDRIQGEERVAQLREYVNALGLGTSVTFVVAPANDTWARDHGPLAVEADGQLGLLDFHFNAWGGKFDWQKDDQINTVLSKAGAFGKTPLEPVDFILEGGSIESDGQGTILTTSECLLSETRNGSVTREAVEGVLRQHLGAKQVLWLDHGYLAGDDTDSHIDTLARLCSPTTIAYVKCDDPDDEHYPALAAMEQQLGTFRRADGPAFNLIPLPWPDAIYDDEGQRLPATYANFLIINRAVLWPVYQVPQDDVALKIAAELFPDHEIVPVDCRTLILQHGSLHCVTMQLPAGVVR